MEQGDFTDGCLAICFIFIFFCGGKNNQKINCFFALRFADDLCTVMLLKMFLLAT